MSHNLIPSDDPRLTAYALGELDPTEQQELERLLTDSPEARAAVQEIRDLAGLLTTQLRQEPAPSLTAAQRTAIVEAGSVTSSSSERNGVMSDQRVAALATRYRSAAEYKAQHTPRVKRFAALATVAALLVVVALLITPPANKPSLIAQNTDGTRHLWLHVTEREAIDAEGFDRDVLNDGLRGEPGGVNVTTLSSMATSSASGAAVGAGTADSGSRNEEIAERLHQTGRRSSGAGFQYSAPGGDVLKGTTENVSGGTGGGGAAAKDNKYDLRSDSPAKPAEPMYERETDRYGVQTGPASQKPVKEKSGGKGKIRYYAGFKPANGEDSRQGDQGAVPEHKTQQAGAGKSGASGLGAGGMGGAGEGLSAPVAAGAKGDAGGRVRFHTAQDGESDGKSGQSVAHKKINSESRGIAPASGSAGQQMGESSKSGDKQASPADEHFGSDSPPSNKPVALSKHRSESESRMMRLDESATGARRGDSNSPSDSPIAGEEGRKGVAARRQKGAGDKLGGSRDFSEKRASGAGNTLGWRVSPFGNGHDSGTGKSDDTFDAETLSHDSILVRKSAHLSLDVHPLSLAESEGLGTEAYTPIVENPFLSAYEDPLSTFGVDVDTASYANVRRFLTNHQLPPRDAVRIEELVNYFSYDYPQPAADQPFSVTVDAANCPWNPADKLVRIGVKGKEIARDKRPPSNLVFLVDVSGSMQAENKLPLVKMGLNLLTQQMTETDQVAIVTYSDSAVQRLEATNGAHKQAILGVIDSLHAAGSTNGAAGIQLAYRAAIDHFIAGGTNRVILCTDGDFNVGVTGDDALVELIQERARTKVFFSVFGFGMGNLKDGKLEKLADKGNGHYAYVDGQNEARKMFVDELVGTLVTIAKDVKLQVEFNPNQVGAYRLIGYENRVMAAADFNNDKKDAGDVGAGHSVTALYEVVPAAAAPKPELGEGLRYRKAVVPQEGALARELLTVKLRYKLPEADTSTLVEYPVANPANVAAVADGRGEAASFSIQLQRLEAKAVADSLRSLFGESKPGSPVIEADTVNRRLLFRGSAEQLSETRQLLTSMGEPRESTSRDFNWAAAVAAYGLILRDSQFRGQAGLDMVLELATAAKGEDPSGRRQEFIELVKRTKEIVGRRTEAGFIDTLSKMPREQLESLASVDGKYKNLLRIVEAPEDVSTYGSARDFGRWEGTSYAGQNNLPQGFWVYVYPNWYIWGDLAK